MLKRLFYSRQRSGGHTGSRLAIADTGKRLSDRLFLKAVALSVGLVAFLGACQAADDGAEPAPASSGAVQDGLAETDPGPPGVTDSSVLFGQSAAFSGPAEALGNEMRLGIQAAFSEQNQAGGVHGRMLDLVTLDDGYEPEPAFANTLRLINREGVFALIGEVGTPTSRSVSPLANVEGVPFVGPFTGAAFLRDPGLDNVLNVRASYHQETEEMVERLTEDLGVTRVGVLYQNDSFGHDGLEGTRLALERRGLSPVGSWYYPRNTSAVKGAILRIVESDPEAVIMIGAYSPVAKAIKMLRQDIDPVFMAVSFVGSRALAEELGSDGPGVYVTQVVPLPDDASVPVVAAYQKALKAYQADAVPGFGSLEGYLAGRLAVEGLQMCGADVSRACFLSAVRDAGTIDIAGLELQYGPDDNQGSDAVSVTVIGADGSFHLVERLGGTP